MRLAWFTPWPPQRSGIAGRSAELVPLLASRGHAVDVFVDEQHVPTEPADADPPQAGGVRVQSAHDFVWRHARGHYDLPVYQVGNSDLHQFIWPYLLKWPGLAVLHDARLHHARGKALLSRGRFDDYRAEFAWSHPETSVDAAELGVSGFSGTFYYRWPMVRGVLDASRLVAAHAAGTVEALRETWPGRAIDYLALGEGRAEPPSDDARRARRRTLAVPDDAVLFGAFGGLTADRRVPQILDAFATSRHRVPNARLVLAGTPDPALNLEWVIEMAGLSDVATVVLDPSDELFDQTIAATDVVLSLRWPSAGETSGPWLRALAAGRPTVITDLPHRGRVPTLDPRTWDLSFPADSSAGRPIAVAIDILDEAHSLRLAMVGLGCDPGLRAELGAAARTWWEVEHTVDRMADDYDVLIRRAASKPQLPRPLLEHMRPTPCRTAVDLVAGVDPRLQDRLEELCESS